MTTDIILMGGKQFGLKALGFRKADAFRVKLEAEFPGILDYIGFSSIVPNSEETPVTEISSTKKGKKEALISETEIEAVDVPVMPSKAKPSVGAEITALARNTNKCYDTLCQYSPEFAVNAIKVEDDLTDKEIKDAFEVMILQLYPTLEWAQKLYPLLKTMGTMMAKSG